MSPPTRAAVPITSAIADARPGPVPARPSTTTGRYGRLIWVARNDTPKIRKIRRTVGPPGRARIAPNARVTTRPSGITDGRTSREPNVTSSAVPTDRPADSQNTADNDQPKPSIRSPARAGPSAKPTGRGRTEDPHDRAEPGARRDVADAGQHHAGVAELEADQQHAQRELPRLARQRHAGEHDGLDERAPDDDGLAAVLVGPHAPQRDERHADDEDQGAEQADERQPVVLRHAHLAQVGSGRGRRSG